MKLAWLPPCFGSHPGFQYLLPSKEICILTLAAKLCDR